MSGRLGLLFLLAAVVGGGGAGSPCSWTLPSALYGEFSVSCTVPLRHTVSMHRQLCGRTRRKDDDRLETDLATGMTVRNDTISYTAVGRYSPAQVGLYVVTLTADSGRSSPYPQLILPLVRIRAVRWPREAENLVTCLVEGVFGRGKFSLLAGDGADSSSEETVFSVSVRSPGGYESRGGRVRLTVTHTNNSMVFVARIREPREERRYRCAFAPRGCIAAGLSDPIVLSSSRLEIEPQYVAVREDGPAEALRVGRLCCRYRAPDAEQMRWERSDDCRAYETVGWSAPGDRYSDAVEVGDDGFLVKTYTSPRFGDLSPGADYDAAFCLASLRQGDPRLPPGTYRCVWNGPPRSEGEHERSTTIPEHVDISLKIEENRLRVRCDFERRPSRPEGSRLDIERVGDGTVVFTVPLGERDLRDAARAFSSSPSSPNVTVRVLNARERGDEEETKKTSVEVVLNRVLLPNSAFRCRISDRCGVSASKIAETASAERATTTKTTTTTATRGRTPSSVTNPEEEKTTDPASGDSNGGIIRAFSRHHDANELRRWSYTSCSIATVFVMISVVLTFFA